MVVKTVLLTIVFNVAALIAASAPALAASPVFSVDREFYPYYPSLIKGTTWGHSLGSVTDWGQA